jgi:hypothetical protein
MLNARLRTLTGCGGAAVGAGAMRRLESGGNVLIHDTVNRYIDMCIANILYSIILVTQRNIGVAGSLQPKLMHKDRGLLSMLSTANRLRRRTTNQKTTTPLGIPRRTPGLSMCEDERHRTTWRRRRAPLSPGGAELRFGYVCETHYFCTRVDPNVAGGSRIEI